MKEIILPEIVDTEYIDDFAIWEFSDIDSDLKVDFKNVKNAGLNLFIILRSVNNKLNPKGFKVVIVNIPPNLSSYEKYFYEKLKIPKINTFKELMNIRKNLKRFFYAIGDSFFNVYENFRETFFLAFYILYKSFILIFKNNKTNRSETIRQMEFLGYNAVGIVVLINVLISLVMSLQGVIQLDKFGMGIYAAPSIGLTLINELGPVMTAIIIIGRSGSAVTAEVATMNVNEELDGLTVMGINPIDYVIVPKIWAFSIMGPVLGVIGTFVGIFAGTAIAVLYLNIGLELFLGKMFDSVEIFDLVISISKNFTFSIMIVVIAVIQGIKVNGGAEEVGLSTTKSVVYSLIGITILNSIFSIVYL